MNNNEGNFIVLKIELYGKGKNNMYILRSNEYI